MKNKMFLTIAFATLLFAGKISLGRPTESLKSLGGIWKAIGNRDLLKVKKIVKTRGFDINQTIKHCGRVTPLLFACYLSSNSNQYLEIVKFLLENGAEKSVNIDDGNGYSPLFAACDKGSPEFEIIELLLKYGAEDKKAITRILNVVNTYKKFPVPTPPFKLDEKKYNLMIAVQRFYNEENQKIYIDKFTNDPEIYVVLTKKWLNNLKSKTPFLTQNGEKIKKEGKLSDVRIHTQF